MPDYKIGLKVTDADAAARDLRKVAEAEKDVAAAAEDAGKGQDVMSEASARVRARLAEAREAIEDAKGEASEGGDADAAARDLRKVAEAEKDVAAAAETAGKGQDVMSEASARVRARLAEAREAIADAKGEASEGGDGFSSLFPTFEKAATGAKGLGANLLAMAGGPIGVATLAISAITAGLMRLKEHLDNVKAAEAITFPELTKYTREAITPAEEAAAAYEKVATSLDKVSDWRKSDIAEIERQTAALGKLEAAILAETQAEIDLQVAKGEMTPEEGARAKTGARRAVEDDAMARERQILDTRLQVARAEVERADAAYAQAARPDSALGQARDRLVAAQAPGARGREPELADAFAARNEAVQRFGRADAAVRTGEATKEEVQEKKKAAKAVAKADRELAKAQQDLIDLRRREFDARVKELRALEDRSSNARSGVRDVEADIREFEGTDTPALSARRRAEDLQLERQRLAGQANQTPVPPELLDNARGILAMADQGNQPMVALLQGLIGKLQNGTDSPELRGLIGQLETVATNGVPLAPGDRARIANLTARLGKLEAQAVNGRGGGE